MTVFIVFEASVTNAARRQKFRKQVAVNLASFGGGYEYRQLRSGVVA
jgi:hypothetical protein